MQTWMETFTVRWELGQALEPEISEVWVRAVIEILRERIPDCLNYLVGFLVVKELTICYLTFSDWAAADQAAGIVAILDKNREKIVKAVHDGLYRNSEN